MPRWVKFNLEDGGKLDFLVEAEHEDEHLDGSFVSTRDRPGGVEQGLNIRTNVGRGDGPGGWSPKEA